MTMMFSLVCTMMFSLVLCAHSCTYCEDNLGRTSYYCKSAKQPGGDELILSKISTIVDRYPHTRILRKPTLANEHEFTSAHHLQKVRHRALFKRVTQQGPLLKELAPQLADLEACVRPKR
jgi:hypothetical protein